jgi:hypothetical protein
MSAAADQRHRARVQRMVKAMEELERIKDKDPNYRTSPEYARAVRIYNAARVEAYGGK